MDDKNIHTIQEEGVMKVDRILIGICGTLIPSIIALFAIQPNLSAGIRSALSISIVLIAPALFTLLWHSVRWPMRIKARSEAIDTACKEFSDDVINIVEKLGMSEAMKSIKGPNDENVVQGEDGKVYIKTTKENAAKKGAKALLSCINPENPIMSNTLHSHSFKICEAQNRAIRSPLEEKRRRLKHFIDFFSRHTRYYWFSGMLGSALIGLLILLK